MTTVVGIVRRSLWLVLLTAAGGAAFTWWRDRSTGKAPGPAEWPPLATEPSTSASVVAESTSTSNGASGQTTAASTVNALVDAPEARSGADNAAWVEPAADGSCPLTHPIKANDNSGIFHVPDGRFYARTKAERCYTTADAAVADGYRQAKN